MNVAFITTEYAHKNTPKAGGIGTFYSVVAKGLVNRGHSVHIVMFYGNKDFSFKDDNVEITVKKNFFRKNKLTELLRSLTKNKEKYFKYYRLTYLQERKYMARELSKFIKGKDIDIIEVQDYGGMSLYIDENIPVVIRCHGTNKVLTKEFRYQKPESYNKIFDYLETATITDKNNNIVATSNYVAGLIDKYFGRKDVSVIYNGADTEIFKPNQETDILKESIFYFGTLSQGKGSELLCEIFNQIKKKYPNTTLHLIGRGEKYFNFLKKNVLEPKYICDVFYRDGIENTKLPEVLSKANVIVFPTKGEHFPFVFLEAMALEKVIITSDINPAFEIIEHGKNGFIAKNKADFIKHICDVFEQSVDIKKIGSQARKTVEENFTDKIMVDKTIDYYQNILNKDKLLNIK